MEELWQRIEKWLLQNNPDGLMILNEGASDEIIQETEQIIGIELPQDVRDFYKIHNGENSNSGFFYRSKYFTLEEIRLEWLDFKAFLDSGGFDNWELIANEKIQDDAWDPKWIPVTTFGGLGWYGLLDLNPTESGTYGQIIGSVFEAVTERDVYADGFTQWITAYVNAVEAGKFVYSAEAGEIICVSR